MRQWTAIVDRIIGLPFYLRQKRLAARRRRYNQQTFVEEIVQAGGDRAAAIAIWNELLGWCLVDGFTPSPNDPLASVFGLVEEELDEDLILANLNNQGIPAPGKALVDAFGAIDSPLRVAQFVSYCRSLSARTDT